MLDLDRLEAVGTGGPTLGLWVDNVAAGLHRIVAKLLGRSSQVVEDIRPRIA
jgi:hypothetical protein